MSAGTFCARKCFYNYGNDAARKVARAGSKTMTLTSIARDTREDGRFAALMEATYKKVFSLAYRLSGNRSDAEDLTQEAFFRAYRSFDDYEGDKPFENWIFRIVTRLFLDLLRSRRRRVRAMSYDVPLQSDGIDEPVHFDVADSAPNPEAQLMNASFGEDLQKVLNSLPEEQRALVILADVEQMPYREIAELLGKPVGTIRSRLHRAHKLMRSKLERLRECKRPKCTCGFGLCAHAGAI
jgi:RNA polymerase sigma-70 factor (ECF subfamily)